MTMKMTLKWLRVARHGEIEISIRGGIFRYWELDEIDGMTFMLELIQSRNVDSTYLVKYEQFR